MASPKARQWAPAGVLAVGCGFLLLSARQLAMPLVEPLSTLPTTVQGFTGRDIEVPPEQRAIAGMSSYVMRIFEEAKQAGQGGGGQGLLGIRRLLRVTDSGEEHPFAQELPPG